MDLRYARNIGAITPAEQVTLQKARVCIVGCGGLGGFLVEYLGRLGIGHITAVDGDRFERSNLNRQLLSEEANIGASKAAQAKEHLRRVNGSVEVTALDQFLTAENAAEILAGHHLVLDALDSIPGRMILQRICKELDIPLVHGAVEGWFGQVTTVFPGDDTLCRLYPGCNEATPPERGASTLSFAPALIASVQTAEAVKVLLEKAPLLRGEVLFADLLQNHFDTMPI